MPKFKYRIQYGDRIRYGNKIDYDADSAVLTVDGTATMIFHPEKLKITSLDELRTTPVSPQERRIMGGSH